jgi:hypothetical protein
MPPLVDNPHAILSMGVRGRWNRVDDFSSTENGSGEQFGLGHATCQDGSA